MKLVNVYFDCTIVLPFDAKRRINQMFQNRQFESYSEKELLSSVLKEDYGLRFSVIFFANDISVYIKN